MNNELNYEYRWDSSYNYPSSYVLKNQLSIRTEQELKTAKEDILALRCAQVFQERIAGIFDFYHLKCIHKLLFGDIYEWAGKPRTINPARENPFCSFDAISELITPLLLELKSENYLNNCRTKEALASRLAYYFGRLYAVHPFREGNCLSIRIFIEHLSWRAGFELNLLDINKELLDSVCAEVLKPEYISLEQIIVKSLTKRE